MSALPNGESPAMPIRISAATASLRPARAKRVTISTRPMAPSVIRMLDGSAKKPRTFARTKNIYFFFHAS